MNLPPESTEAIRKRVQDKHRSERRERLENLEADGRRLRADLKAFHVSYNAAMQALAVRVNLWEGAVRYMQQELRGDDTTVRLPSLEQ